MGNLEIDSRFFDKNNRYDVEMNSTSFLGKTKAV